MKTRSLSILAGILFSLAPQLSNAEPPADRKHEPEPGDVVVVYRNHFKPENYGQALKILSKSLKEVAFEDPAVRDSYVLRDKKNSTVMGVVMWDSKKEYEAWKASGKGKAMVKELEALRAKPVEIEEYELFLKDDE